MTDDRVKVHRRDVTLNGRVFTALSLRPSVTYRFATNYFHETWHIISDSGGGRLLGRICWALAFQRRERTIFVIDPRFLVPNPFDADPSSPIVIVNADLGTPSRDGIDRLRSLLPWTRPSEGTVTLNTQSLAATIAAGYADDDWRSDVRHNQHRQRSWINEVNGTFVLSAPDTILKRWGVALSGLGERGGEDAEYLDYPVVDGEVQVLGDFKRVLARAVETRSRLFPGQEHVRLSDREQAQVWFDPARVAFSRGTEA